MQKRSSISRARYSVALLATLAAGCGGAAGDEPLGAIPVDSEPIAPRAYVKPLGAAVEVSHALEDEAYRERLITTFTSITTENALKWEDVEPERGGFRFEQADRLFQFAERTDKRVRGHPLVWDHQLPEWVEDEDWSAPELRKIMRDHIRAVMERYRGRVDEWDVVNEPLAQDNSLKRDVWFRTLGPGWIAYAFEVAHRVDPKAKLFVNELNAEESGSRLRAYMSLVRELTRRGVPIDGVGLEFHTRGEDAPPPGRLRNFARATAQMGLSWAVTELDVHDTDEARQAEIYGDVATVCAQAANCTGVTVWGVTDRFSWLGEDSAPLPFDAEGNPKPALRALVEPLSR